MEERVKLIASNKKAYFEYFLYDFLEVGISLVGTEIKSIRFNGCSLKDSYITIKNGEAYILGMNIAPYQNGNIFNHEALRTRKLLMHKKEITKYSQKVKEKGFTLLCTKAYFKDGKVKLEIALGKGKKLFDKKEVQKQKDIARENEKYGKLK